MNCKPGDLAVVVSVTGATGVAARVTRKLLNRIVRVVRLVPPRGDFHCSASLVWEFEKPEIVVIDGRQFICTGMADEGLRPITPPPNTVTDEEVRDLYAPNRDEVTA